MINFKSDPRKKRCSVKYWKIKGPQTRRVCLCVIPSLYPGDVSCTVTQVVCCMITSTRLLIVEMYHNMQGSGMHPILILTRINTTLYVYKVNASVY
jgi:hypothetical protein